MKRITSVLLSVIIVMCAFASCETAPTQTSSVDTSVVSSESISDNTSSEETSSQEETSSEEEAVNIPVIDQTIPLLNRDLSKVKRVKILPFGDSFTAIKPAAYRFYLYEMLYKNGNFFQYVGTLDCEDTRLGDYYQRHQGNGGHTVLNAIDTYKTKFKGIVDYDVMVLFFGINGYNPSTFESEYETLLNLIFEDKPDAYVYAVGAPNPETAQKTEKVVNSFSQKGFKINYVNMFQRDDVKFDKETDYIRQTVEKGHLNDSGNFKFASVIFENIKDTVTELNKLEGTNRRLPVAVSKVTLSEKKVTLTIGEEKSVTYEISPETADVQSVIWYTSDSKIATVNEYGTITATGEGEAIITAVSLDGMAQSSLTVTVSNEQFKLQRVGEKVFGDKLVDSELWEEGAKTYIEDNSMSNISFKWADQGVKLKTKEEYKVGKNFTFEISYAISAPVDQNAYVGFILGEYEIRVYNTSEKISLYFKNSEVGSYTGRQKPFEFDKMTLIVKDGVATIYVNNEKIITADTQNAPTTSKVILDYQYHGAVASFDNVNIFSE